MDFRRSPGYGTPTLDLELLNGFRFSCLPGCGLCCYTTPYVTPVEKARLVQIDPSVRFLERRAGGEVVESRPGGGACHFLANNRCRCHSNRPFPCAEFPLTVQLGSRPQASVVLACPGVDLSGLTDWGFGRIPADPPQGFETELARVESEYREAERSGAGLRARNAERRVKHRLARLGVWRSSEELRAQIRRMRLWPGPEDFSTEDLPDDSASLEELPLFFDSSWGRVAVRRHQLGVEFVALRELGGVERISDVLPLPERAPAVTEDARALLEGYLFYSLLRDQTLAVAYDAVLDDAGESLVDLVARDLRRLGARALTLALLRRALDPPRSGPLSGEEVIRGVRASDLDWLDRPSSAHRL